MTSCWPELYIYIFTGIRKYAEFRRIGYGYLSVLMLSIELAWGDKTCSLTWKPVTHYGLKVSITYQTMECCPPNAWRSVSTSLWRIGRIKFEKKTPFRTLYRFMYPGLYLSHSSLTNKYAHVQYGAQFWVLYVSHLQELPPAEWTFIQPLSYLKMWIHIRPL